MAWLIFYFFAVGISIVFWQQAPNEFNTFKKLIRDSGFLVAISDRIFLYCLKQVIIVLMIFDSFFAGFYRTVFMSR
jgi:hypothetical protein